MNDHIPKPIDVAELFATLARWVKPSTDVPATVPVDDGAAPAMISIPGLDIDAASRRVGGNTLLLMRLLQRFRESQSDVIQRIKAALAAGDDITAKREAHTLKGLAGNIGATALAERASALEHMLTSGETPEYEEAITRLEQTVLGVIARLPAKSPAIAHSVPGGDSSSQTVDPAALASELKTVTALIAEDDTRALAAFNKLQPQFTAADQREIAQKIEKLLGRYDFEQAKVLIASLAASLPG
jgi:two-component system sensor histidine kinase/response regulator